MALFFLLGMPSIPFVQLLLLLLLLRGPKSSTFACPRLLLSSCMSGQQAALSYCTAACASTG